MKKGLERFAKRFVPWFVALLIRVWFRTCRVREHGLENKARIVEAGTNGHENVIAVFWHYSIFYIFYMLRAHSAAVMVSASKDGDYVARLAEHLGFTPVRGSKHRRGREALKDMLDRVKAGANAGIVGDGSKGPAYQMQKGAVYIASKTGAPLVPMAWAASSYKAFSSWDRTALPMPFSQVDFFYGEPLYVPAGGTQDELEVYRLAFEERLQALYRDAWQIHGKDLH